MGKIVMEEPAPKAPKRKKASGVADSHVLEMLKALPAAIYTTDAEARITFYNEAAAELWGCRPEPGKSTFCGSW